MATALPAPVDPGRTIALNYARVSARPALAAFWALDAALGRVVAVTTQPLIGQLRLTWWHERLCALDEGERLAEPVLAALAVEVLPHGVSGASLAALVEGWEALLADPPLSEPMLADYAAGRGGTLFAVSGAVLGNTGDRRAGEGWALIDFASRCSIAATAELAWRMAGERLSGPIAGAKPMRILARLARAKARGPLAKLAAPVSRWTIVRAIL